MQLYGLLRGDMEISRPRSMAWSFLGPMLGSTVDVSLMVLRNPSVPTV